MEWKKMRVPAELDGLLLSRQVVFLRAGDEIQFPPEDEERVVEAMREHSAAVSASVRKVVVGEQLPVPTATGEDGIVEVEWEEDDVDGAFTRYDLMVECSRWIAERYGIRIWVGFEPPYEEVDLWVRPYNVDAPNTSVFERELLDFGDMRYHLGMGDQFVVVPESPVLLIVDHDGTPVAHVRRRVVEMTTRAGLIRKDPFDQLVLWRIMNTATALALSEEEVGTEEMRRARDIAEQCATAYINLIAKRCDAALRTAKSQLDATEDAIRQLAAKITEKSRQAEEQRFVVEQLLQRIEHIKDTAREEYERICSMNLVESVNVVGAENVMEIVTSDLKINDTYRLGKVRIKLDFQSGNVSITNLTKRRRYDYSEWDHPHVKYGVPCFGNLQGAVAELMGRYEAAAVVEVILAFLQTYNPADVWGKNIVYWEDRNEGRKTA